MATVRDFKVLCHKFRVRAGKICRPRQVSVIPRNVMLVTYLQLQVIKVILSIVEYDPRATILYAFLSNTCVLHALPFPFS